MAASLPKRQKLVAPKVNFIETQTFSADKSNTFVFEEMNKMFLQMGLLEVLFDTTVNVLYRNGNLTPSGAVVGCPRLSMLKPGNGVVYPLFKYSVILDNVPAIVMYYYDDKEIGVDAWIDDVFDGAKLVMRQLGLSCVSVRMDENTFKILISFDGSNFNTFGVVDILDDGGKFCYLKLCLFGLKIGTTTAKPFSLQLPLLLVKCNKHCVCHKKDAIVEEAMPYIVHFLHLSPQDDLQIPYTYPLIAISDGENDFKIKVSNLPPIHPVSRLTLGVLSEMLEKASKSVIRRINQVTVSCEKCLPLHTSPRLKLAASGECSNCKETGLYLVYSSIDDSC